VEKLETRQMLATIAASAVSTGDVYRFSCVAKAQPDEWYTGYVDTEGNYVSGPYYDLGDQPAGTAGREKVNQDYVWGMAESNGLIYFSSSGNVLALAGQGLVGIDGQITPARVQEGAQSQYPSDIPDELMPYLGDWRPPEMHVYDPATNVYKNITPDDSLLQSTLGLRSAGAGNGVVLFAGPDLTYMGMNVFAFNASTQEYLGSKHLALYNDVRNWVTVGDHMYTGVAITYSQTGEGAILEWTGSRLNPFRFSEVTRLDLNAANLAVHNNRLFVGTWPMSEGSLMGYLGYDSTATAGIWMSPEMDANGRIRVGQWKKVWDIMDYEVDPVIAQSYGLGAMASFDGYLYWGTMQVPAAGTLAIQDAYPGYTGSTQRATRSIAIFRCDDFETSDTPDVQLLYGDNELYAFTAPPDMSLPGVWTKVANNTGPALFGKAGFENSANCYTWTMKVYENRLYVGTLDGRTSVDHSLYIQYKGDVNAIEAASTENWMGADLWCFFPDTADGQPVRPTVVDKTGQGNPLNHGIRTMIITSQGFFLGTANSSNLLTENNNKAFYPDAPNLKAGGWELVRVNLTQSAANIPFTLSGTTVSEGITTDTVVGTLAVTNPEMGNSYTFSLLDNAAGRFKLSGNQLIARSSYTNACDYELFPTEGIVVRVTDAHGVTTNQAFTINVTEAAERPARIDLSGLWVKEGSAAGTVIGTLNATDQDAGDTTTLSLTNDAGGRFQLVGDQLQVKNGALLDYETATGNSITVRATDKYGLYRETTFTIYVMNLNEAPTAVLLSAATVEEGCGAGTLVGTLQAVDSDTSDTFTYAMTDSAGGRFQVAGDQLQVANGALLNYSQAQSHNVVVTVTDSGGQSFAQTLTITVIDVPTPSVVSLDVQQGAVERAFVRYADVHFASPGGLNSLVTDNRVALRRYKLTGSGGTAVSLTNKVSAIDNVLRLDFGSRGLTTDGYYEISLDLDDDGTFETVLHFYRLMGDLNADGTVDATDRSLVTASVGTTNPEADVDGNGTVNSRDRNLVYRARGTLTAGLPLDD
jgi:hypothetical protein